MKPARVLFFAWDRFVPRARSHLMSLGMTWENMGRNGFLRTHTTIACLGAPQNTTYYVALGKNFGPYSSHNELHNNIWCQPGVDKNCP